MTDKACMSYLIKSFLIDIHRHYPVIISLIAAHRTGIKPHPSVSCLLIHIQAMRTGL